MRQSAKINTIVFFSIAAIVIIGLVFYILQRQPSAVITSGECLDITDPDRDSCFLVLAGNNNDTSYCNSVSREDMRSSCFNQSWTTNYCEYSDLIGIESCEVDAAIEAKNIVLCDSISNYDSYIYCRRTLLSVAVNDSDISVCKNDLRCLTQFLAVKTDESYCQTVDQTSYSFCRSSILSDENLINNPYLPPGVFIETTTLIPKTVNRFLLSTQFLRPSLCTGIISENLVSYFDSITEKYSNDFTHQGISYLYSRELFNLGLSAEDVCLIQNAFSQQNLLICDSIQANVSKIICQANFIQVDCLALQNEQILSLCLALQNKKREEQQSACLLLRENPLSDLCIVAKQ